MRPESARRARQRPATAIAIAGATLALLAALAVPAEPAIPADPADGLPIPRNDAFADPCVLGRALHEAERALGGVGMTERERLDAITALGHDQRYYLYVKSWLQVEQFALVATRDAHRRSGLDTADLDAQLAFFARAIRALDLE